MSEIQAQPIKETFLPDISVECRLGDIVLFDLVVQGAAADPKPFSGEFLVPAAFGQHLLQKALFIVNDGFLVGCSGFLGGRPRPGDPGWARTGARPAG